MSKFKLSKRSLSILKDVALFSIALFLSSNISAYIILSSIAWLDPALCVVKITVSIIAVVAIIHGLLVCAIMCIIGYVVDYLNN